MSPAERDCPTCSGYGRLPPEYKLCPVCDGTGRDWLPGGPLFGCRMSLSGCKTGEIVVLGTGHRGRVIRHMKNGTPTTMVNLIGAFDDLEETWATAFPSATGVSSVASASWHREDHSGDARGRDDQLDPLQRKMT